MSITNAYRHNASYNDIKLKTPSSNVICALITDAGVFSFRVSKDGTFSTQNSGLTITRNDDGTIRLTCEGSWYTSHIFIAVTNIIDW